VGLEEFRYGRTLQGGGSMKVILRRVSCLSLHAACRTVISRHDVHQQVLLTETTMTFAGEAGDAEVSRPDAVEADLIVLADLCSTDDIDPVGITRVLQQPGHCRKVIRVDADAKRSRCWGDRHPTAGRIGTRRNRGG